MLKLIITIISVIVISVDCICLGTILPQNAIGEIYDINECLSDKKEFIYCLFQWQIFTWKKAKDTINTAGIIILEILMTIFALPYNILFLIVLIIGEIIRFVIWCFMKCFRKMEKTND